MKPINLFLFSATLVSLLSGPAKPADDGDDKVNIRRQDAGERG
jgi:hypothetical protein